MTHEIHIAQWVFSRELTSSKIIETNKLSIRLAVRILRDSLWQYQQSQINFVTPRLQVITSRLDNRIRDATAGGNGVEGCMAGQPPHPFEKGIGLVASLPGAATTCLAECSIRSAASLA